jgi:hypothetical protein
MSPCSVGWAYKMNVNGEYRRIREKKAVTFWRSYLFAVAQLAEALRYKVEGSGFDS